MKQYYYNSFRRDKAPYTLEEKRFIYWCIFKGMESQNGVITIIQNEPAYDYKVWKKLLAKSFELDTPSGISASSIINSVIMKEEMIIVSISDIFLRWIRTVMMTNLSLVSFISTTNRCTRFLIELLNYSEAETVTISKKELKKRLETIGLNPSDTMKMLTSSVNELELLYKQNVCDMYCLLQDGENITLTVGTKKKSFGLTDNEKQIKKSNTEKNKEFTADVVLEALTENPSSRKDILDYMEDNGVSRKTADNIIGYALTKGLITKTARGMYDLPGRDINILEKVSEFVNKERRTKDITNYLQMKFNIPYRTALRIISEAVSSGAIIKKAFALYGPCRSEIN